VKFIVALLFKAQWNVAILDMTCIIWEGKHRSNDRDKNWFTWLALYERENAALTIEIGTGLHDLYYMRGKTPL